MNPVLDPPQLLGRDGRPFTGEQARAVLDAGGDLLLSAAAGSGKTSVLVERFVRHVLVEDVAPGRILAITFTEKAAGEMRQRARERLLEIARDDAERDPVAARRARDAARDVESTWISTIHGFCARLLRGHAVAAGLDPAFAVLDEAVARSVRDAAWEGAFAAWLEGGGDAALDLAAGFTADRLRIAITEVHDALRSAGQTRPRLPAVSETPVPDADALRGAYRTAVAELAGADEKASILRARAALDRCGELLDTLGPGALPDPGGLAGGAFKAGNTGALKTPVVQAYLEEHEAFHAACVRHRATGAVELLDDLLQRYASCYEARKQTRSGLDFDDLELLARDVLASSPAVRDAYRERFERILVDEFQDSNPLQVELFDLLSAGQTFVVGDELQSIYGFRHADVGVFRARRAALAERERALALTVNFRSDPEILAVVNAAFAPRFGEGFAPLVPGGEAAQREPAAAPPVELLVTGTQGWDDVDLGELPRAARWRHAEARLLAQRVRDLVDAGEAAPEDVVVLMRSTGDLPVYERALQDAGLQTLAAGGRGYWGRQVVRDLCAWLAALANPHDEEALYGVLASPLVGVSTDALALIAEAGKGEAWRLIDAAFGAGDPAVVALASRLPDRLPPGDRDRLAAFRDRFVAERELSSRLGLDELLQRAVDASDYDLHVLRLPGGARRLANVNKLLRLAAEHERAHGRDVRGLVDRANAELEADAREADAPVELGEEKAVRLMTIHAAKGLEFPVVCLADLGRGTSNDTPALLVEDGRVGVRLAHLDGTSDNALDYEPLRERVRDAARGEEDRILYVGLTRAEDRLILSGGIDVTKWPRESMGGPPLAWLGRELLDELTLLPAEDDPDRVLEHGGARLRCAVSTPATVGRVLRHDALAPAGATLPDAPKPPVRPPLPAPQGPPPAVRSLSYSALAQWRRCGYRFYLERVLGLPQEDTPFVGGRRGDGGLEGRVRGSLVHEALEVLEVGAADGGAEAARRAAAERYGVSPRPDEVADMVGLVAGFTGSPLAARLAAAASVRKEHAFALPLGDAMLTGVVDVLAYDAAGAALVVDYKTDRVDADTDLEALIERDYGVQRRVYALAALRAGAPSAEVAYAFLERPGDPVVTRFEAADAPRLEQELEAMAAGALGGEFAVAAEPHLDLCGGCPGRRALCIHPEELTGRELPLAAGDAA